MKHLNSLFRTLAVSTFIAILLLVLLELIFRATQPDSGRQINPGNFAYAYHPWAAHRSTPGYSTETMTINRYGWRGDEYSRMKPPGTRRVILLGDSVAFSSPFIKEEATIASYLQAALEEGGDQAWDVINMAVPSGNGAKALATLAHEGIHFEPDVVVAVNGANDLVALTALGPVPIGSDPFPFVTWDGIHLQMRRLLDPRTGRGTLSENLFLVLQESALFRYGSRTLTRWLPRRPAQEWPSTITFPDALDPFLETQTAIHYLTRGSGAVFIHFIQPYLSLTHRTPLNSFDREAIRAHETAFGATYPSFLDQAFPVLRTKMRQTADRHGFTCVDLTLLLNDDEHPFIDTVHTSYASPVESLPNKKIALAMAKAIRAALDAGKAAPSRH